MHRSPHRAHARTHTRQTWRPRASARQVVTLRIDYATAAGRVGLGLARNLSLQGLYMAHTSGQHTPVRGDCLTVIVILPTGQACKFQTVVIHGTRQGCGLQFGEGLPQTRVLLAHYWSTLEAAARAGREGPTPGRL